MSNVLHAVYGTPEVVTAVTKLRAHWPSAKEINAAGNRAVQVTEAEVAENTKKLAEAAVLLQEVNAWVKGIYKPQY